MKKLANLLGLYCVVCTLLTSCGSSITATGFSENNNEWDPDNSNENSRDKDPEHPEQKKEKAPKTSKSPKKQAGKSFNKADKKGAGAQPKSLAALDAIDEGIEIIQMGTKAMDVFTDEEEEKYYFKNKKHKKSNKRTYLTDEELSHVQKKVIKREIIQQAPVRPPAASKGSILSRDTSREPSRRGSHASSTGGSIK